MNIYKSIGIASGIVFGLIICFIVFKFANKDHKAKTAYDERQQVIRGRGYRVAFYTAMILEVIFLVLDYGNISLPVDPYLVHASVIFISCTVLGCHAIWNGAYWGLNNDRRRYYIVLAATVVLNAFPVIMTATHGELMENGKLSPVFINLLSLLMLAVLGIVMLIRDRLDRNEEKE
ncbi:MAG: hypothetical protein IJI07_07120 [Flexilinea sp.]|nr:hypothetical protein [Flexilinea sp.]